MTIEKASRQKLLEQTEKFCQLLGKGYTIPAACRESGIPPEIFRLLMNEGKNRITGTAHKFHERIRNAARGKGKTGGKE